MGKRFLIVREVRNNNARYLAIPVEAPRALDRGVCMQTGHGNLYRERWAQLWQQAVL